jgi:hypothetical protein
MIALFACQRLEQNGNGGANVDNNKSLLKSLIVSDCGRIQYHNRILKKIGRAPITNKTSHTYCTISIILYWELTHQAYPNIPRTCGSLHLRLPAIFLWGEKTRCALIATPNVDNANRRQKKGKN